MGQFKDRGFKSYLENKGDMIIENEYSYDVYEYVFRAVANEIVTNPSVGAKYFSMKGLEIINFLYIDGKEVINPLNKDIDPFDDRMSLDKYKIPNTYFDVLFMGKTSYKVTSDKSIIRKIRGKLLREVKIWDYIFYIIK